MWWDVRSDIGLPPMRASAGVWFLSRKARCDLRRQRARSPPTHCTGSNSWEFALKRQHSVIEHANFTQTAKFHANTVGRRGWEHGNGQEGRCAGHCFFWD